MLSLNVKSIFNLDDAPPEEVSHAVGPTATYHPDEEEVDIIVSSEVSDDEMEVQHPPLTNNNDNNNNNAVDIHHNPNEPNQSTTTQTEVSFVPVEPSPTRTETESIQRKKSASPKHSNNNNNNNTSENATNRLYRESQERRARRESDMQSQRKKQLQDEKENCTFQPQLVHSNNNNNNNIHHHHSKRNSTPERYTAFRDPVESHTSENHQVLATFTENNHHNNNNHNNEEESANSTFIIHNTNIFDRLYKDAKLKEVKSDSIVQKYNKERESELAKECTFSPQLSPRKSRASLTEKRNSLNSNNNTNMNNRSNKKSKPSMSPRYYDFNDFLETQKQRNEIAKERQLQLEKEIFEKETQREKIPTTALKRKINQKLEHQSGNHNKNDDGGYKGPIKNWDKRFESYQRRKSGAQAKKQHKTDPIDKEENKIKANVAFNRLYADFIMRTDKNAEKQLAEEQYRRTSLFAPRLHGTESLHRAHPIPEEHEEDRPTPSPPPPATQQEQTPRGNELLLNLRPAQLTRDQLLDTNSTSSRQTPRQISPRKGSSPSVFDKLYADHQVNSPLARQRRLEERRAQEVEQSMRSSPRINKNTDALLARRKSHPDENHALVSKREALILKQKQREEERIRLEREKQAKINAKFDLEKFLSREEKFHQKREEVKHSYLLKEYVEEMTQCTFMPELSPRSRMLYLAKQQEIQYGVMPRARSPSYDEAIVLPERNSPKRNPDNTNLSQLEWELEEMMKGWHSMI